MQRKIKLTQWFVYEWRKLSRLKPHRVILRSPLLRIHYYHNKRLQVKKILVPYMGLQLNCYPNNQLDLLCSDNLSFQCTTPSTWLINCVDHCTRLDHQLEKDVGSKVLQFIQTMKIMKLLGHKTLWCTYTATSSRERDELGQELRLQSQFVWTEFA